MAIEARKAAEKWASRADGEYQSKRSLRDALAYVKDVVTFKAKA